MNTARLETFSDGVFAIAATLLILDVHTSERGSVAHQLLHAWPSYGAYALTTTPSSIRSHAWTAPTSRSTSSS